MKKYLFSLLFLVNIGFYVCATNVPAGSVSGTWTKLNSPYIIDGNLTVNSGNTLLIEAGAEVRFSGNYSITVNGKIIAIGTITDSIIFKSIVDSIGWGGIKLTSTLVSDTCRFSYCLFKCAKVSGNGGAINATSVADLLIENCKFINNRAANGGAIYTNNAKKVQIIKNIFISNTATSGPYDTGGGAIFSSYGRSIITGNKFYNNSTSGEGGAIYLDNGQYEVLNNLIVNNYANYRGGGLYVMSCKLHCINNTIMNNKCDNYGGGFYAYATKLYSYNNIIRQNVGIYNSNVDVEDYHQFYNCNTQFAVNGSNNITSDPLFVLPNNIKGVAATAGQLDTILNSNWALSASSPCIDAGTDLGFEYLRYISKDLNGAQRVLGGKVDIGAYENKEQSYPYTIFGNVFKNDGFTPIPNAWVGGVLTNSNGYYSVNVKNGISVSLVPRHPLFVFEKNSQININGSSIIQDFTAIKSTTLSPGNLNGTLTKANSPYILTGNITVPDDQTLTIEPGVTIYAPEKYGIEVLGSLSAIGNISDSIKFLTPSEYDVWDGIYFNNQAGQMSNNPSNNLNYCILKNSAKTNGYGALYFTRTINGSVQNSLFINNYAFSHGASISAFICSPAIKNNTFIDNFASSGGGVYCYNSVSEIANNLFYNNRNSGRYTNSGGGAISIDNSSNLKILSNIFVNNNGQDGGALQLNAISNGLCQNNYFINSTGIYGGAISINSSPKVSISQNVIVNNSSAYGWGGAFYIYGSTINFFNNTIAGNSASGNSNCLYANSSKLTFKNSIICNTLGTSKTAQFYLSSSNLTVENSCLDTNDPGTGNIFGNPIFYQTYSTFNNITTYEKAAQLLDSAWMINANSPCVNAGTADTTGMYLPVKDIIGANRIMESTIDIGAYECFRYKYSGQVNNTNAAIIHYGNLTTPTNASGAFEFYVLSGEKMNVYPTLQNWTFTPASISFNNAYRNETMVFTGSNATSVISVKNNNPAIQIISDSKLIINTTGTHELNIISISGQLMKHDVIHSNCEIDISWLKKGAYLITLSNKNEKIAKKFIKID